MSLRLLVGCPLLAFLAFPVVAQNKQSSSQDVVVTGRRLSDTQAALNACLARHCPPDQDITATLAHAENQFVAGDYHGARRTLLTATGRNKRFAKDYPVPVSNLLRANSTVALHLGESEGYRIGAIDVLSALKSGLSQDDPRVLAAQIEVGDSFARVKRVEPAFDTYHDVARRAHALGLTSVEGHAMLRSAVLAVALQEVSPEQYRDQAQREIDALIANREPKLANFAFAAKVLRAQSATRAGDKTAIDRLVADFKGMAPSTRPMLIYAPTVALPEAPYRLPIAQTAGGSPTLAILAASSGTPLARRARDDFEDQWVDIGLWISPDGKVREASVLRQSPNVAGRWIAPILKSISGRRYAPLALDANDPGLFRIERYTYTSFWGETTGVHVRERAVSPQLWVLDLSPDPVADAGKGAAAKG